MRKLGDKSRYYHFIRTTSPGLLVLGISDYFGNYDHSCRKEL
jgi:hypothetical protein